MRETTPDWSSRFSLSAISNIKPVQSSIRAVHTASSAAIDELETCLHFDACWLGFSHVLPDPPTAKHGPCPCLLAL